MDRQDIPLYLPTLSSENPFPSDASVSIAVDGPDVVCGWNAHVGEYSPKDDYSELLTKTMDGQRRLFDERN